MGDAHKSERSGRSEICRMRHCSHCNTICVQEEEMGKKDCYEEVISSMSQVCIRVFSAPQASHSPL